MLRLRLGLCRRSGGVLDGIHEIHRIDGEAASRWPGVGSVVGLLGSDFRLGVSGGGGCGDSGLSPPLPVGQHLWSGFRGFRAFCG